MSQGKQNYVVNVEVHTIKSRGAGLKHKFVENWQRPWNSCKTEMAFIT
jgi:hypothetical protein